MNRFYYRYLMTLIVIVLAACTPTGQATPTMQPNPPADLVSVDAAPSASPTVIETAASTATPAATATVKPSPSPTPTALPEATRVVYGPDNFPENINPLTGLPVEDPSKLAMPPALISISNFPVTARPQYGLSVSPIVYEVYVGYGMTRFLATVYGDMTASNGQPAEFGPIRSGRLPYEQLRTMLNGFMLIASGDEGVLGELKLYTNVWNPASNDVNGVVVDSRVVENTAKQYLAALGKPTLNGLVFDPQTPQGGKSGVQLWIPYGGANMVIWKFDPASGGYLRYQDNYDGQTYIQAVDKQTQEALNFENVVVLFAPHHAYQQEKIEIGLSFVKQAPALLFRDGKMFEIYWTSQDQEYYQKTGKVRMMRFVDGQGNPVPLKPGQTWVEVVTSGSPYFETANSTAYADLYNQKVPGSGAWGVQFWQPVPDK